MIKPTHTTRSQQTGRRRGITLIEMMVALAITSFVILVVNQLFNSVTTTVSRGIQVSELLQKSRTLDEQLAFETDLLVLDPTTPSGWQGRMVGPEGHDDTATTPGGFLGIVQRIVEAPLTVEDGIRDNTRFIRSDQLVFIYDQNSNLDAGAKHLPAMAPSSPWSFTGDQRDSDNADYVRMWYGHVLQIRQNDDPTGINMASAGDYAHLELGDTTFASTGNPNILAQDWVLGRHALFLTDPKDDTGAPLAFTFGRSVGSPTEDPLALAQANMGGTYRYVANGVVDVANMTLEDMISGRPAALDNLNTAGYHNRVLSMMFADTPLLTAAKPMGLDENMYSWDMAPTHTYFMGGVSDFIVEFAGDVVNDTFFMIGDPTQIGPDGELDRDPDGRIKWYTLQGFSNPKTAFNSPIPNPDAPVTYPVPGPVDYPPTSAAVGSFDRADAAFIWHHKPTAAAGANLTANFRQWPWMLRIRYRLHDRNGKFEGREVNDPADSTGVLKMTEPGVWYETIIPVNYQNEK